jgi:hypothetical protein
MLKGGQVGTGVVSTPVSYFAVKERTSQGSDAFEKQIAPTSTLSVYEILNLDDTLYTVVSS